MEQWPSGYDADLGVDPRFKTIRWLKNGSSLSSFEGYSDQYQGFLGWGLGG